MEIRKEIESLAIWCIPATIVVALMSAIISGYARDTIQAGGATPGTTLSFITALGMFIKLINNIVVGIWLYLRSKEDDGRAILWLLFGIVAHYFAALMYIGLKIYEQQKAHNKSLQATPENGAPMR